MEEVICDICNEIITINVSGETFQTYRKTLEYFPNSLLGDYTRRQRCTNQKTGELYFDRPHETFESILYYYQSKGELDHPPTIPLHIFIKELKFFDIGNSVIDQFQIDNGIKEEHVTVQLPELAAIRAVWLFLEYPDSSGPAKLFAISSIIVIVLSLIMFVIVTMPEFSRVTIKVEKISKDHLTNLTIITNTTVSFQNKHQFWIFKVNTAVIIWFTAEFALRLLCCPNKLQFVLTAGNIIDFLSILPFYIALAIESSFSVIRVIRVLRVLKLSRHSRGLQTLGKTLKASYRDLMLLLFSLFIMILIFASILYYAEYQREGTTFSSIPHSAWWAIVTMTTVGYGDMTPVSVSGKIISSLTVVCGVMMMSLPVPSVVSHFSHFSTKEENRKKAKEARKAYEKRKVKVVKKKKGFVSRRISRLQKAENRTLSS